MTNKNLGSRFIVNVQRFSAKKNLSSSNRSKLKSNEKYDNHGDDALSACPASLKMLLVDFFSDVLVFRKFRESNIVLC